MNKWMVKKWLPETPKHFNLYEMGEWGAITFKSFGNKRYLTIIHFKYPSYKHSYLVPFIYKIFKRDEMFSLAEIKEEIKEMDKNWKAFKDLKSQALKGKINYPLELRCNL